MYGRAKSELATRLRRLRQAHSMGYRPAEEDLDQNGRGRTESAVRRLRVATKKRCIGGAALLRTNFPVAFMATGLHFKHKNV